MNLFQGLCARAREMLLVLLVFAIQVLSLTIFFLVSASPLIEPILSWIQFSIWMREPC